ncbi:hypothetical protein [Flavobacterium sp.]|jgi:hypothetical protein|uniref:hypothetical protein n=1 Tax=Flavobacterium sp. TaxID=239 RepID=UPI0022CCCD5B|nr:hypothetical protein [Flavobacterium sp.]MCZ8145828.1 hypothetical protein [Flavobacterium sp.]MCZ8366414.1 hypothetical protein [Flavobacterium sp.]
MKKIKLLFIFTATICFGQTDFQFDELNIPSAPGLVLLDQSPSSIEKPTNPKDVTFTMLSIANGGGAVEFSPYWLKNHADYTVDKDFKKKFPILQTLAFSFTSITKNDTLQIGGGFRFQLYREYQKEVSALKKLEEKISTLLANVTYDRAEVDKLIEELKDARKKIKWNIEFAAAMTGFGTTYSNLSISKIGAWLNFRHTPINSFLDIVLLARYSKEFNEHFTPFNSENFDFGVSLSHQGKRYDINFEYIHRSDLTISKNFNRLTAVLNYELFKGVYGVASFGKNFNIVENLFTIVGIKFGISRQKMKLEN